MSLNKILLKEKVLTKGGGSRRVVLDYESNLIYQYADPSNVIAYFEPKKGWIVRDRPYYNSGGWGRGSSGDADGFYTNTNARELLRAINARIYEVNSMLFLTRTETEKLSRSIRQHNKLVKRQNRIAADLKQQRVEVEELPLIKEYTLRLESAGTSLKGLDAIKTVAVFEKAIEVFINRKGKEIKVEAYTIRPDVITQETKVIAFRDEKGQVFMNSEVLNTSHFENAFLGKQSIIQKKVREISKYNIPFNILESANLKLSETKVIESGPESDHVIKGETRHFTGALLLENAGRKFLMDIDRQEINHGIFNAFFVEVNKDVTSIEQAYVSMKPQSVIDAEKAGIEVKRQGEWFFIATDKTLTVKESQVKRWKDTDDQAGIVLKQSVSHGKGRPNELYKPIGFGDLDQYVCGMVTHSGREHRDLDLGSKIENVNSKTYEGRTITYKLWTLVGNTTVGNFTITGQID